jgi:hAT family C-terminal dimerisation region
LNIATIGRPVSKPSRTRSELDSYLDDELNFDSEELLQDPLKMWKQIEHRYPTVALMAKDILSIPASGVGVERIFNTAGDTCHYRRNRLNPDTIEMIMLVKWYEKLGLWTPGKNSDLFNEEEKITEPDQIPMDEQPATIIQEEIEWETEISDEFVDSDEC